MKVAHFIGTHANDDWATRAGWYLTRITQRGPFGMVTHSEAIHAEHSDGSVTIASASLRDGGVRAKERVMLNPAHWLIADMRAWDVERSIELLARTKGQPYDLRGALATRLPGNDSSVRWFCNKWVSFPFLQAAGTFGPHHLAAICMSAGRNATHSFFWDRGHA